MPRSRAVPPEILRITVSTVPPPLFTTDFPRLCLTREVDGLLLVFHRPSGATHFLENPAPEMLDLISGSPMTAEDLTDALCERFSLGADAEARTVIAARLAELLAVGLVRHC